MTTFSSPLVSPAAAEMPSRHELLGPVLDKVKTEIAEGSRDREATRTLPFEEVDRVRASGLLNLRVPREYGGPGGTISDVINVVIELASVDSNISQALRAHFGFIESLVDPAFPEDERRRWLDVVRRGELIGNAIVERGGQRPKDIETRVRRRGGRLVLNGTKFYSTGSLYSSRLTVLALDDDDEPLILMVKAGLPGMTLHDDWTGMGQRLTATGTTSFEDVELVEDDVVRATGATASLGLTVGSGFRQLYLGAVAAGIAANAVADITEITAKKRRVAQHSVARAANDDQLVHVDIGVAAAQAYGARAAVIAAAGALDDAYEEGSQAPAVTAAAVEVAQAQTLASQLALQTCTQIFEAGGASNTATELGLDRHWRNARTLTTHNSLSHKRRVVGDFLLNGTAPPPNGFF